MVRFGGLRAGRWRIPVFTHAFLACRPRQSAKWFSTPIVRARVSHVLTMSGRAVPGPTDKEGDCFVHIAEPSVTQGRVTPVPRELTARLNTSDRVFRGIARGGGVFVLVLLGLVGTFLTYRALQALRKAGFSFLTTQTWNPNGGGFGIAAVIVGTILIALVAVLVAIPLSLGTSLYISEYAPRSIQ